MIAPVTPPTNRPRGRFVGGGLLAGALAPILFVVTVAAGGWLRPGFSQLTTFVSELGESGSPTAWIVNPAFVAVGLLLVWFAVALHRAARANPRAAAFGGQVPLLFGVVGVAFVLMAAWTCSAGCPIAVVDLDATPSDALHNAAAIAALASLGAAALMVAAARPAGAPEVPAWYRGASTVAGSLVGVLSAVFLLSVLVANRTAIGVSERALLLTGLAWVEATAVVAARAWRADPAGAH